MIHKKKKKNNIRLMIIIIALLIFIILIILLGKFIKTHSYTTILSNNSEATAPNISSVRNVSILGRNPADPDFFPRWFRAPPSNESLVGKKIINLNISDLELEDMKNQNNINILKKKMIFGKNNAGYSDTGCLGDTCISVKLNSTNNIGINFNMFRVTPGEVYSSKININCIRCEPDSVYFGIIWIKHKNESKKDYDFELGRIIQELGNTGGYLSVEAVGIAPEFTIAAIPIIRAHMQGTTSRKNTEFYIDIK